MKTQTFSELLRETMEEQGLTEPEAAKLVGCSVRAIAYWRSGQVEPKAAMQEGIMARLTKRRRRP